MFWPFCLSVLLGHAAPVQKTCDRDLQHAELTGDAADAEDWTDARGATGATDAVQACDTPADARFFARGVGFVGGALGAFLLHEAGHVAMNYALGNRPRYVGISGFGFVPFFAISPDLLCDAHRCTRADGATFPSGRRGMYLISTAGFLVQHLGSEMILSLDPQLRLHRAPVRKGMLAFNIVLSIGYALASVAGLEEAHGDAGGAARVAGLSRWAFAPLLVAPAFFDLYRYFAPDALWAAWLSRGSKAAMVGIAFTF